MRVSRAARTRGPEDVVIRASRGGAGALVRGDAARGSAAARASADDARALDCAAIEREFAEIDVLTEGKVLQLARSDSLAAVETLEFRVDATDQSLAQLGEMLPALRELTLSRSIVVSFRDLGTSLRRLQVLRLEHSQVQDLDGVCALGALRELHLAHNQVRSLTPLAMHDALELLDLSDNRVGDLGDVDQLGSCLALRALALRGNPVARLDSYRPIVAHLVPLLAALDGAELAPSERCGVDECALQSASAALEQLVADKAACGGSAELTSSSPPARPPVVQAFASSSSAEDHELLRARPSTPRGPPRAPISAAAQRGARDEDHHQSKWALLGAGPHGASAARLGLPGPGLSPSASAASFAGLLGSEEGGAPALQSQGQAGRASLSGSSDLTHGSDVVFAGNLASSMRRRKRATRQESAELRLKLAATNMGLGLGPAPGAAGGSGSGSGSPHAPEVDSALGSARSAISAEDDESMQRKLEELLQLSCGLERELSRLQGDPQGSESPRNKLLRRAEQQRKQLRRASSNPGDAERTAIDSNDMVVVDDDGECGGECGGDGDDSEEARSSARRAERRGDAREPAAALAAAAVAAGSGTGAAAELLRGRTTGQTRALSGLSKATTWTVSPRVKRHHHVAGPTAAERAPMPDELLELAEFMTDLEVGDEELERMGVNADEEESKVG